MDEKAIKILDAMKKAGKPLKTSEISELTGFDGKEISKYIKVLKKEDKVDSPKRCYYAPKE